MKKVLTSLMLIAMASAMIFAGGANQSAAPSVAGTGYLGVQNQATRGSIGQRGRVMGNIHGGNYIEHNEPGIVITGVLEGSAAQEAGIQRGDIVLKFNGIEVNNLMDVQETLSTLEAGQKVPVEISRGNQNLNLQLTLETRLDQPLIGVSGVGQRPVFNSESLPEGSPIDTTEYFRGHRMDNGSMGGPMARPMGRR